MTTEELIRRLTQRGYAIGRRRLIDWAGKGALSHPVGHGRGRRQGRAYDWPDDTDAQAAAVHDMLALDRRIDRALVSLWLLGYAVPLQRVRGAFEHRHPWLAWTSERTAEMASLARTTDDWLDGVSRVAAGLSQRLPGGTRSSPATVSVAEVEVVLNLFINPHYRPSLDVLAQVIRPDDAREHGVTPRKLRKTIDLLKQRVPQVKFRTNRSWEQGSEPVTVEWSAGSREPEFA